MRELTAQQFVVFYLLLSRALHIDSIYEGVPLRRGQLLMGTRRIATLAGQSRETVRSILKALERRELIEVSHPGCTPSNHTLPVQLITISNYNDFTRFDDEGSPSQLTLGVHPNKRNTAPYGAAEGSKNLTTSQQDVKEVCRLAGDEGTKVRASFVGTLLSTLREPLGRKGSVQKVAEIINRNRLASEAVWMRDVKREADRLEKISRDTGSRRDSFSERDRQLAAELPGGVH